MKCAQARRKLCAYLDDEIIDGSESELAAHFSSCGRCRKLREKFTLTRFYLRKLKKDPEKAYRLDIEKALSHSYKKPLKPFAILSAFVIIFVSGFFYYSHYVKPALLASPKQSRFMLEQSSKIYLKTSYPTLVNLDEQSYALVDGSADFSMHLDYLEVTLSRGNIYFVLSKTSLQRVVVKAAGFQIISLKPEFFAQLSDSTVDIELLQGELVIKYGDSRSLKAEQLFAGQAVSEASVNARQSLKAYKLSAAAIAALGKRINQIKEAGLWFKRHPKKTRYQANKARIELWKGD